MLSHLFASLFNSGYDVLKYMEAVNELYNMSELEFNLILPLSSRTM